MYKLSKHELSNFLGSKFFSVEFYKKNGELRRLHGRLGVKRYIKGTGIKDKYRTFNYLVVYDMQKKAYRTLNVDTIVRLVANNKNYLVL